MTKIMQHVSCVLYPDRVKVYAEGNLIGYVQDTTNDGPAYFQYVPRTLTFNDMAIIQDNWAAWEETYKKVLTTPENAVR
jgi:hypothetical protein